MAESNPKTQAQPVTKEDLGELLTQQTATILNAVDERLTGQKQKILAEMHKRLAKLEERFMERMNSLASTLDHFLKRMTDMEDEFAFMKADVNRIK